MKKTDIVKKAGRERRGLIAGGIYPHNPSKKHFNLSIINDHIFTNELPLAKNKSLSGGLILALNRK